MPVLSRAAEAQARLAAARSATADAQRSQVERLEELDRRMEGPCASSEEDDETLEQYAQRRLQLAKMPSVDISSTELDSVYEPSDDTFLLLDALEADRERLTAFDPALCAEVGCGSGVVITSLSKLLPGSRCMALDINETALAVARRTATLNGRADAIEFVRGDLLTAFRCFEYRREPSLIDVLVFNPPYVPSEPDEIGLGCKWAPKLSAAWAGGIAGREVIDRLLPQLRRRIAPSGLVYMVLEALNKPDEVCATMQRYGFDAEEVRRTEVVHEEAPEQLSIWRFTPSLSALLQPGAKVNQHARQFLSSAQCKSSTTRTGFLSNDCWVNVTDPKISESELKSFPPASEAARRAVKAAAAAASREAAAEHMVAEEVSADRIAEAVVSEEDSAGASATDSTTRTGPWAGRYTFPEQDERTLEISELPASAGLRDVQLMIDQNNAKDELDLVLRRDAVSVEAIYFSRSAAMSAAAGLSGASLLDKTPKVTLKVADC